MSDLLPTIAGGLLGGIAWACFYAFVLDVVDAVRERRDARRARG